MPSLVARVLIQSSFLPVIPRLISSVLEHYLKDLRNLAPTCRGSRVKIDSEPVNSIPLAPLWGGLLGVLLFWTLAIVGLFELVIPKALAFSYLSNYAALIVTFTGAIWWGLALSQTSLVLRNYLFTWSLVPCVLAWFALALPIKLALVTFSFLLSLQLVLDYVVLWRGRLIAAWVWRLRRMLTIFAVPSLLVAAVNFA